MGIAELFLVGVGLSMDAFAVSVCKGLNMRGRVNNRHAIIISLFFGGFQALMPLIGWLLGRQFEVYIKNIDHWVAFLLLAYIGGKMIFDTLRGGSEPDQCVDERLDLKELLLMAIATSIDALAVGITFAFLSVQIAPAVCLIGATTFVLSYLGVLIGNRFGNKFQNGAQIAGGVILIGIGLKILLEHLDIL